MRSSSFRSGELRLRPSLWANGLVAAAAVATAAAGVKMITVHPQSFTVGVAATVAPILVGRAVSQMCHRGISKNESK